MSDAQEAVSASRNDYEYRIIGCSNGDWRVTEWGSREKAVEDYEECGWGLRGFERRVAGDDSTIQRKQAPDQYKNWVGVTQDKIHIEGEEVPEA